MRTLFWSTIKATRATSDGATTISTTSRIHSGTSSLSPEKSCNRPTSTTASDTTTDVTT